MGSNPGVEYSLVAKLITFAPTRSEAIARMRRASDMFVIEGIHTSIPLHQRIMQHPDWVTRIFWGG